MITTKNFTSSFGATITVKYPTGAIFMRERNYLTVSCEADDYYLKRITLAGKTINFGRYYLQGNPITLDVTPYYAKLYTSGTISLVVENQNEVNETFSVSFKITKFECYSPFKEFAIPEPCVATQYARITPPNRMLWDGSKSVTSMFAAMRKNAGYAWILNGTAYNVGIVYTDVNIGTGGFLAEYKFAGSVVNTIKRSIDLIDTTREYVYMRWKTPWGYSVEHLFYLDTFGADKDNKKELESAPLNYSERSDYVRKGSIYINNIRDPYDLFYYKTLETAEVVEIWTPIFNVLPNFYMPDGTEYEAVKITGSNVKDAVVDGITQQTITFDFELS